MPERRDGMTVPLPGPLHQQAEQVAELAALGYTDVWSSESNANDAFTPLVLASQWAPSLRLGTAIVPAYTRGPALVAQSAATLASLAPGRFALGVGSSSDVIVERWNAIPFENPYRRVRDLVRFLRAALEGQKVSADYDTFSVRGFRLGIVPPEPPPILVAALRGQMLALAASQADGAILNWLSASDAARVSEIVNKRGSGRDKEIVARIFVCPNPDRQTVIAQGRRAVAAYLNVPVYRAFHEWLGRGDLLAEHWQRWAAGDRAGSLEAIPEQVVDDLIVHGTPDECRAHIDRYFDSGVTTSSLQVMAFGGIDVWEAAKSLAPRPYSR
ncbi:LLM class F420-dependent oxidoreductase [Candidatus Poriferisocius sp.]|uniref:LLM class F420-dependent oxidoreductase n=1 Tax=Candidatus Poriferisocius sp. TaxID=3101276 RepID=UPI003B020901